MVKNTINVNNATERPSNLDLNWKKKIKTTQVEHMASVTYKQVKISFLKKILKK